MNRSACQRAEILAGAIALGEASDGERETYRSHLSGCESCVRSLGGERSIERTMAYLHEARDSETWDPDMTRSIREKMNPRSRVLGWSVGTVAACFALALAIRVFTGGGTAQTVALAPTDAYGQIQPIEFEHAPKRERSTATVAGPQRTHIVVVHNVVTLTRPAQIAAIPPAPLQRKASPALRPAIVAFHVPTGATNGVPVWRQGGGAITTFGRATVAQSNSTQIATIAIAPGYAMREAAPIGGENAINPVPAPIAYAQGAEGTTVFEVVIDGRGAPTKCSITKSSGYLSLDDAVCKAAMKAHYTPRMVGGHAVPGVYDDAFTFRQGDDAGKGF